MNPQLPRAGYCAKKAHFGESPSGSHSLFMGNGSSSQQCSGVWNLARDGDAAALRAGIARIPPEIRAAYLDWGEKADHRTPVAIATLLGHDECVKVLLDTGADANRVDRDGMGPLHLAVKTNNPAIAKLLLESPLVDCNVADARAYTPLLSAAEAGHNQVLDALLRCERVNLFAFEAKSKQDALGIARKACRKAGAKDRSRFKECLGLVEKRLLIRSGHLYEFINPESAKQWTWERRNYQVFQTADPQVVEIDFYREESENPSAEMWYHYRQSNQESNIEKVGPSATQTFFTEHGYRFALRTDITVKKKSYQHVLECAASSAEDFAFWKDLPKALRESKFSTPDSTCSASSAEREPLNAPPHEVNRSHEPLRQEREHQQLTSEQRYQHDLEQAIQVSLVEASSSSTSPPSRPLTLLDEETRRSLSRPSSVIPSPTSAAPPATAPNTCSESDCIVCFDGAQCAVCLPCGHVAMCMDCAVHVKNTSHVCPVCRSSVNDIVRIYHV